MARRRRGVIAWLVAIAALFQSACATPLEREQKATAAPFAERWLGFLDQGEGATDLVWADVASVTKQRGEREWLLKLWIGARASFGEVVERDLLLSWSRDPDFLDGWPDGDYWEVVFRSEFANKDEVHEELLLRWEDGRWRVVALDLE